MLFTRAGAAICVILLIGGLSMAGITLIAWLGPMSTHGTNIMHTGGTVIEVGPDRDFVFETGTGKDLNFVCTTRCRASLRHLLRHLKEKAHTDVYYVQGPGHELLAVDVD
jgi:hypothetical protein